MKNKDNSPLRELKGKKKLQYILDYYKLPLFLLFAALYLITWLTMRQLTKKETVLYIGLVNLAPSEELICDFSDGYLEKMGYSRSEDTVCLYRNLFLSADASSEYHPYSYATKLKILGAIDAGQLDLVLMNREAFDAFSQNGYLEDLLLLPGLSGRAEDEGDSYASFEDCLCSNIWIEEDNSVDILLGNESEYQSVTTEGYYGLDLTKASSMIRDANLSGTVYLGLISNSTRKEESVKYIDYLINTGTG